MLRRIAFLVLVGQVSCAFLGERDICRPSSADHTWNVHAGDQGQLAANVNRTSPSGGHCSIKLTTCSACHFEVDFNYLTTMPHDKENHCRDDFVRFQEVGEAYRREFCGQLTKNITYEFVSEANEVSIDFFYTKMEGVDFTVYFEAVQNLYFVTELTERNSTGYIQSPFFPNAYPHRYSTEFFFSNSVPFGRVLLIFTDFDISQNSLLEVIDTNGSSVGVYSSETFRPPALLSSGFALGVKFSANGKSASGFRAQFFFRHAPAANHLAPITPFTQCGGLLSDFGGTITMLGVGSDNLTKPYDCVWIIKPPSYLYSVLHLSLNLVALPSMDTGSKLWIHRGTHSTSPLQHLVTSQNFRLLRERMWTSSPKDEGFYIRLQGRFEGNSTLILTYAAFDYWTCFGHLGALCNNQHCIHKSLFCDGFDHCGDGSDELSTLCVVTAVNNNFWWNSRTPNFMFPPDFSQRPIDMPLLVCCLALVVMLTTIGLAVCWVVKRKSKRRSNVLSSATSTVSESFTLEPITCDTPPRYEPPPSYEDISKTLFQHLQQQAEAVTSTNSETATTPNSTQAQPPVGSTH